MGEGVARVKEQGSTKPSARSQRGGSFKQDKTLKVSQQFQDSKTKKRHDESRMQSKGQSNAEA